MTINDSLRYGYARHREIFLDVAMNYQFYVTILTSLTLHPIVFYLLVVESKSMKKDIHYLYILTHASASLDAAQKFCLFQLGLILNEWSIFFGFRMFVFAPFAVMYCEGPLCRMGIGKQALMVIVAIPVILITSPFVTLMARMHQTFIPIDSKAALSARTQITLVVLFNAILIANVAGFGYYGRDHDDSERILQEPELSWLTARGGTIFLFGPPGDPQYFKWELLFLLVSIFIISPFLYFFTADSMRVIRRTTQVLQSGTTQVMARKMLQVFFVQCAGAVFCYIVPLGILLTSMIIDSSFIPGWLFAPGRVLSLVGCALDHWSINEHQMLFQMNGQQFCVFFIMKNPTYRKIIASKFKLLLPCFFRLQRDFNTIAPNNFSVTSRHFELRF